MTITSNTSTITVATDEGISAITGHPNIFLNQTELGFIKKRLIQNPWKDAYNKFIGSISQYMISYSSIHSILDGSTPPSGDKHDYYSEAPYCGYTSNVYGNCYKLANGKWCCDGHDNPNVDRTDYNNIQKLREAVRSLALAYQLTGNTAYANKAIDWIKKWCLDPTYKMNPKMTKWQITSTKWDYQPLLEISYCIAGMNYGIDLLWNYPGFNATNPYGSGTIKSAYISWLALLLTTVGDIPGITSTDWSQDDWGTNLILFIATSSILTDNTTRLNNAISSWKGIVKREISSKGEIKMMLTRQTSLSYSILALRNLTDFAELARHRGIDLYTYIVPNTATVINLELSWDFHAPYVLNPSSWPHAQVKPYIGQQTDVYELAYTRIKKSKYRDVITKWGGIPRYLYDDRFMGPTTLTHGSIFI